MNLAWWLNSAWLWKCRREAARFEQQTHALARTQAGVLADMLRRNRHTWFGTQYRFGDIESPRDFQRAVPLATYADFAPAIARVAAGEASILTREPTRLLEPTSGSTGGEKLIPYTATLSRQFQRAISVWIADLFTKLPAARLGRAYWSISPALGPRRRSPAGIPIGFDDDAAYLGTLEQLALTRLLVVPGAVARIHDLPAFRYATILHLLHARDLALISVWNPTFLTTLLGSFNEWQERLCADLARGVPGPIYRLPPDARRAEEVRSLARATRGPGELFAALWPGLALISCWGDAAAASQLGELRSLFPGVFIQPKGLLATEGCVSIPLVGQPAPALALGSHFFEFQEDDERRRCRLAHQVDAGGRYRIVLTTGGGLYRYQLHDLVEVVGFKNQCPLLRFLGKAEHVSDLVGEKLAEPHVRAVLDEACQSVGLAPRFALLVPVLGRPPRYRLYLQGLPGPVSQERLTHLTRIIEDGLSANPHYRYAVGLGQLDPVEVALLAEAPTAETLLAARWHELGKKAGALKPAALDAWTGWPECLAPLLLPPRAGGRESSTRRPTPAGSR